MKAKVWYWSDNTPYGYAIYCLGCGTIHALATEPNTVSKAKWGFNGNLDSPTFTPSLLVKTGKYVEPKYEEDQDMVKAGMGSTICHSFITNGQIQYLGDCTHHLTNQTVELPTWDTDANLWKDSSGKFL